MATTDEGWWSPFRTIGSVSIVHVDLSPETAWEAEALEWLDARERARRLRFAHEGPRRRFSLCRAAVRAMLCEELRCTNEQLSFRTAHHGKPYALVQNRPAPASFNISHSGEHGLVAYAPAGRLGVDVEERDPQRDLGMLIDTVLGPEERAALALTRGQERTHLFFKIWTLKEAVMKALGQGFSMDAVSITVPPAMLRCRRSTALQLPTLPNVTWHTEYLGNQAFAAAVAFELNAAPAKKDSLHDD